MTREQQILSAAMDNAIVDPPINAFIAGAEWADVNPDTTIDAFKVLESKLAIAINALEYYALIHKCVEDAKIISGAPARDALEKLTLKETYG